MSRKVFVSGIRTCLLILMCVVMTLSFLPLEGTAAGPAAVYISSAEELAELSENCTLDTWSDGVTVKLTCDIDLSGTEFSPIPQFAGYFDGGGFTVSGLEITSEVSTAGLFRKILEGGTVVNLNVEGTVTPEGSGKTVGGIAGENAGTIENCSFAGRVSGSICVGGIAGYNTKTGVISGCSVSGNVLGEHRVGGVAGESQGIIENCVNRASVNTEYVSVSLSDGIDLISTTEDLIDITDIGGIAGLAEGPVTQCVNSGDVGYLHVGYNVGGITGRQSGYLSGCTNFGNILGRKDVGGISGQIDPATGWSFSGAAFEELQNTIDELSDQIDIIYNDAYAEIASLGKDAQGVIDSVGNMEDAAASLVVGAEEWINSGLDTINDLSDMISYSIEALVPASDDLALALKAIGESAVSLMETFFYLARAGSDLSEGSEAFYSMLDDIESSLEYGSAAADRIRSGISYLMDSWGSESAESAFDEISEGLIDLSSSIGMILNVLEYDFEYDGEDGIWSIILEYIDYIIPRLSEVAEELDNSARAVLEIGYGIGNLGLAFNQDDFSKGMNELERAIGNISSALADLENLSLDFGNTLRGLDNSGDDVILAVESLADASDALAESFSMLGSGTDTVTDLAKYLSGSSALEFSAIDTDSSSQHDMYTALQDINTSISDLTEGLTNSRILSDLQGVTDALGDVINSLVSMISDAGTISLTGFTEDISSEGSIEGSSGSLTGSVNYGDVSAYTNTGGIAGAITIDLSFDLEDELDISGLLSESARYLIYAVVYGCVNNGTVTAERSAAGGIVGRMDYGAVIDSESGGSVVSKGSYAGGIAGYSVSTLQGCISRAKISGTSYVGGIAGLGKDIYSCLSIPYFSDIVEYTGSIAGYSDGDLSGNYFAENACGAVDGFSFSGKAESTDYENIVELSGYSELFTSVSITFVKDGEIIETRTVPLGEMVTELPEVVDENGKFWRWDTDELSEAYYNLTISGSYTSPVTTISTGGNIPMFLAEGVFRDGQAISAEPFEPVTGKKETAEGAYRISVSDYDGPLTIRMRADNPGTLYVVSGDGYTELDYLKDGSYIVFEIENGDSVVLMEAVRSMTALYIVVAAVIVAAAAVICVVAVKRKKGKRPAGGEEGSSS